MAFFINQKKELKKILLSRVFLGYSILMLVFLIYLVLPSPKIPQLEKKHPYERGFISDLMGEPTDNYLTNLGKDEIINFYLKNYSRSSLFNLPLFARVIKHRPEYAGEIINDMHNAKNTSFLIEINQPLRESIIIKGYKTYFLTITTYLIKPAQWQRGVLFLIIFLTIPLVGICVFKQIKEIKKCKKYL